MRSGRLLLLVAALVASVAVLTQARAGPLDAETCAKLQTEHTDLERAGVEKDMEKGPDWAKANLGLEKLQRVRPRSIAQASRIPGMTPAAVSILLLHIELRRDRAQSDSVA